MAKPAIAEGKGNMKKIALVALGAVAGFGVALSVLPEAKGASDIGAYQSLDLFSNAFERVRANYKQTVRNVVSSESSLELIPCDHCISWERSHQVVPPETSWSSKLLSCKTGLVLFRTLSCKEREL